MSNESINLDEILSEEELAIADRITMAIFGKKTMEDTKDE